MLSSRSRVSCNGCSPHSAAITITLPPLRERRGDILEPAERLLDRINRQFAAEEPGYQHKTLSASAKQFVKRHDWPGNVRRLQNVLLQAAVMSDSTELARTDLAASLGQMPPDSAALAAILDQPLGGGFDLEEYLNHIHRQYLRRAMQEAKGVKAKAAHLLGIKHYQTLDHQLKRLNVTGDWQA
jgi:DNA-binding NtrC family response regulator